MRLGLAGAVPGLLLAVLTVELLGIAAGRVDSLLLPNIRLGAAQEREKSGGRYRLLKAATLASNIAILPLVSAMYVLALLGGQRPSFVTFCALSMAFSRTLLGRFSSGHLPANNAWVIGPPTR